MIVRAGGAATIRDHRPAPLTGAVNREAVELQRAAERRGLRVQLPGYVPDQGLAALLGGATLFVYPSRYEGFGLPLLEAMAAGVPVVATDIHAAQHRDVRAHEGRRLLPTCR